MMLCQWREASYTAPSGEVQRVYTVCNVDVPNTDNWLRLPYLASSPANRLYVHMRFSVRQCVNFPDPATLQQCKVTGQNASFHSVQTDVHQFSKYFYQCDYGRRAESS